MSAGPVDLSSLSAAAEARRRARRRLRESTSALAEAIVDDLRVGDSVAIEVERERITYSVEQVVWRVRDTEDVIGWSDFNGETLTRFPADGEPCALFDCRLTYTDGDGLEYKPYGREVYLEGTEDLPFGQWNAFRRHLATDEELAMFADEARLVTNAFAGLLIIEAASLNERVARVAADRPES